MLICQSANISWKTVASIQVLDLLARCRASASSLLQVFPLKFVHRKINNSAKVCSYFFIICVLLALIILIILGTDYKLLWSLLCTFCHPPVALSWLQILSSVPSPQMLSVCCVMLAFRVQLYHMLRVQQTLDYMQSHHVTGKLFGTRMQFHVVGLIPVSSVKLLLQSKSPQLVTSGQNETGRSAVHLFSSRLSSEPHFHLLMCSTMLMCHYCYCHETCMSGQAPFSIEQHHILHLHHYCHQHIYWAASDSFTLKLVTVMYAESLEELQHKHRKPQ